MPIITGKGMVDYITQTLFLFVDKRQVFGPSVCWYGTSISFLQEIKCTCIHHSIILLSHLNGILK